MNCNIYYFHKYQTLNIVSYILKTITFIELIYVLMEGVKVVHSVQAKALEQLFFGTPCT